MFEFVRMWLVCWLFCFYGISTLFGLFNVKLSQFNKSLHVSRSSYLQICISTVFVYTPLNVKTVPFQTTQFSSIWPINSATTPGQSIHNESNVIQQSWVKNYWKQIRTRVTFGWSTLNGPWWWNGHCYWRKLTFQPS